jgi:hypothetical protein
MPSSTWWRHLGQSDMESTDKMKTYQPAKVSWKSNYSFGNNRPSKHLDRFWWLCPKLFEFQTLQIYRHSAILSESHKIIKIPQNLRNSTKSSEFRNFFQNPAISSKFRYFLEAHKIIGIPQNDRNSAKS